MRSVCRKLGRLAGLAGVVALVSSLAHSASAQTITIPQWMKDSDTVSNSYLLLWQYWRGTQTTGCNLWTNSGDPLNPNDDIYYVYRTDTNGNITYQCPWGSRILSAERPTICVFNANGTTTGDDRPFASIFTLHVEDSASTTGYTNYQYPDDGANLFSPATLPLQDNQGFFAPYRMPSGAPTASGVDLTVNQRTQFARDLLRIEMVVKNNGGSSRRVGGRLLLSSYVDLLPTAVSANSFFLPKTREKILFEKDYKGAFVPEEWEQYDDDEGPNPNFIIKGILKGNGATTPSRVVFGNTNDMFPYVVANAQTQVGYDWTVRSDFELRLARKGLMIYWDPVTIPPGGSYSFVTFAGMGVASHAMSDAYQLTQGSVNAAQQQAQGFIGAVQAPFALPLINGDADSVANTGSAGRSPLEYTVTSYIQNETALGIPSNFSFIQLPDGLKFSDNNPNQDPRLTLGSVAAVGNGVDELTGNWTIQATGIEAGLLPVDVSFGNGFQDTAHTTRLVNVPQGRLFQFGNDWRMITFPFNFSALQDDPTVVFGLPAGSFQIVQYNPVSNQYEQVTQIQAGQSYWVRMLGLGDTFVRINNASPIKLGTRDSFSTQIVTGWNQVGNPSPYTVRVADLRFLAPGGTFLDFDHSVSAGYIRSTLYAYNRKTGLYTPLDRNSLIPPGAGVWIYATSERYPVWPAPQGPKLSITP